MYSRLLIASWVIGWGLILASIPMPAWTGSSSLSSSAQCLAIAIVVIGGTIFYLARRRLAARIIREPGCRRCGYLVLATTERCPECGEPVDPDPEKQRLPDPWAILQASRSLSSRLGDGNAEEAERDEL
ncbi:MAG TPA: hypothetical protein PK093_24120 [Phycisphaerae bacterium]|nr:hypothetical protein [Phycisphaerae bacterium]